MGWYLDDELYDFSLPVSENIKLVANFEKIQEEVPIYIYILAGITLILVIITNYNDSRKKLKHKIKANIKKKLMKN